MRWRIIVAPEAMRDVDAVAEYIAADDPAAARRFLIAARKAILDLGGMPGAGSPRPSGDPRLAGLRIWPVQGFEAYLVFYRFQGSEVETLRVVHGARDWPRVL